jgi:hypothetical protein
VHRVECGRREIGLLETGLDAADLFSRDPSGCNGGHLTIRLDCGDDQRASEEQLGRIAGARTEYAITSSTSCSRADGVVPLGDCAETRPPQRRWRFHHGGNPLA